MELNTKRPPDNLGEPVPIYTASRRCLSVVWQERVLSNCVEPHIVMVDKEALLRSRYKGPGEANQWERCIRTKPAGMSSVCVCVCVKLINMCHTHMKTVFSSYATNIILQTKLCSTKHRARPLWFCKIIVVLLYIPGLQSWSHLQNNPVRLEHAEVCRSAEREEMVTISVMILVGHRRVSCVCLKATVKLKPVQKLLRKISTAPIPNKCLSEKECWAGVLPRLIIQRKNGVHFLNGLFVEVGTRGISHFEGGADQRLCTACFSGQDTNSHITLATAPGEHWGQCFGERSLQFGFQHLLCRFWAKQSLKNIST